MMIEKILVGVLIAVVAAECSRIVEEAARELIRWAVRLSYGPTPRAEIRYPEQLDALERCPGQITKMLYALGWVSRGILEWLWRLSGRASTAGWEKAGPGQVFAAMTGLCNAVQDFGGDIRPLSRARRKNFDRLVTRLRGLMRLPSEVFNEQGAAVLASTTASVCQAYIDNRNESVALNLLEDARPLMERLGRHHQAVLELRRGHAGALLALGNHQQADVLLQNLMHDEALVFGAQNPQTIKTAQLRCWAWQSAGRSEEAEAGLSDLEECMAQMPGTDTTDRQHNQCKRAWTLGEQGRTRESAALYDHVITDRTRTLGPDHTDTFDARHSKGKMFVNNGDGPAAYVILQPVLADMRRVLGAHHAYTLETRKYLAIACALTHPHSASEHRSALRELQRVLRLQVRKHGPSYPHTVDTQRWVATLTSHVEKL